MFIWYFCIGRMELKSREPVKIHFFLWKISHNKCIEKTDFFSENYEFTLKKTFEIHLQRYTLLFILMGLQLLI